LPTLPTLPPTTLPFETTTTAPPDTTTTAPPDTTTVPPTTNTTAPTTTTAPPTSTTPPPTTPGTTSGGGTPGPTAGPPAPSGGGGGGGGGSATVSSAGGVFGKIATFLAPSRARAKRAVLGAGAAKLTTPAAKKNTRAHIKKPAARTTSGTRTANAAENVQLADTTRADTHDGGMPKSLRLVLIVFAALALIGVLLTPRPPALFARRSGEDKGIPRRRRRRPVVTAPASRRN
ncbi:MAG: hypothetical protein JWL83_3044, partial [Actinomycetia bacterium]|nr:hypothetical protein [Actinomycetes bacterium]